MYGTITHLANGNRDQNYLPIHPIFCKPVYIVHISNIQYKTPVYKLTYKFDESRIIVPKHIECKFHTHCP